MKVIYYAAVLLVAVSCNTTQKKQSEAPVMPGAYRMLSQTVNDGKKDSTIANLKSLKIYTDDYMMYANINPADSVAGFGIGTYSADTGTVTEHVIYWGRDTAESKAPDNYTLLIEKTSKGYKQIIPEIGTGANKVKLTEEYDSAGTNVKTALDGAWKQTGAYVIKGKDTTTRKATQFKTYFAGHFVWGHTYADSTNKLHTGIGFGSFVLNGNKIKETVDASSYYQIRGTTVNIDIELKGSDEFKQTMDAGDGYTNVETYQRLKK